MRTNPILAALSITFGLLASACALETDEGEDEPELEETTSASTVSGCEAGINLGGNYGYARCFSGAGTYRVAATCNTSSWPYTRTIYGPWKTRTASTFPTPISWVYGSGYGCNIARTWYQAY